MKLAHYSRFKGLHVVSPIKATRSFDEVREFAKNIAQHIAANSSDKFITEIRKEKRRGRVFIDYTRNAYGQTSVVPYSLRALAEAPIATPLSWEELSKLETSYAGHPRLLFLDKLFSRKFVRHLLYPF